MATAVSVPNPSKKHKKGCQNAVLVIFGTTENVFTFPPSNRTSPLIHFNNDRPRSEHRSFSRAHRLNSHEKTNTNTRNRRYNVFASRQVPARPVHRVPLHIGPVAAHRSPPHVRTGRIATRLETGPVGRGERPESSHQPGGFGDKQAACRF